MNQYLKILFERKPNRVNIYKTYHLMRRGQTTEKSVNMRKEQQPNLKGQKFKQIPGTENW